jgi:hypothetical protein
MSQKEVNIILPEIMTASMSNRERSQEPESACQRCLKRDKHNTPRIIMNEPEIIQEKREDSDLEVHVSEVSKRRKHNTPRITMNEPEIVQKRKRRQ